MAQPVPEALSQLVTLNVEYGVLICKGNRCECALKPTAISSHLAIRHKTPVELWKQYVAEFPFTPVSTRLVTSYRFQNSPKPLYLFKLVIEACESLSIAFLSTLSCLMLLKLVESRMNRRRKITSYTESL
jgi:hypothetical protein